MMGGSRPLLEIRGLTVELDHHRILDGLDLVVAEREIHALLGANGSGKSTLAQAIMGCEGYAPQAGEILFEGQDLHALAIHERAQRGITMSWQEPARFEGLSVRRYLDLGRPAGDTQSYLEMIGLRPDQYLDRLVDKSLSGGERKRIELASVLALRPRLAILDEPASGIDVLSVQEIINVISAFKERGGSVLLISHREDIAAVADRASQLCGGRIICSGDPHVVSEHYKGRVCVRCNGMECAHERTH